jgi:hypothetical protein
LIIKNLNLKKVGMEERLEEGEDKESEEEECKSGDSKSQVFNRENYSKKEFWNDRFKQYS